MLSLRTWPDAILSVTALFILMGLLILPLLVRVAGYIGSRGIGATPQETPPHSPATGRTPLSRAVAYPRVT